MVLRKGNEKARIVQFADEGRTLPDGSKIVYAENDDKIVLYHKHPLDRGTTYVYDRKSGKITVNGKEGTNLSRAGRSGYRIWPTRNFGIAVPRHSVRVSSSEPSAFSE